jgi:formate hydrogenlyase subunit 4
VKLLDKVVAGLGTLLLVCLVVSVGAHLVLPALPGLVVLLGLLAIFRFIWQRSRW